MQFTLSAGGSPKATRAKIEEQAAAIGAKTPAAAKSAALAAKGVSKYLSTVGPEETVTVSISFGITVVQKVDEKTPAERAPANT